MSIPPDSTTAPVAEADRGLRASDAEREATVATLHHALGAGRLDLAETETRVGAVSTPLESHRSAPHTTDL
jgi:hypothetical protein